MSKRSLLLYPSEFWMATDKKTHGERLDIIETNIEELKTGQQKMQDQMDTIIKRLDESHQKYNSGDLEACSLTWEDDGKMVVIAHSTTIIRISAASLTDTDAKVSKIDLFDVDNDGEYYDPGDATSFCATTCCGPRVYCFGGDWTNPDFNNMYYCDLLDLSKSRHCCSPAPFTPIKPLMVQIGESVYFLNVLPPDGSLIFVKYLPEKDRWDIASSRLINKGVKYAPWLGNYFLDEASRVVIGHKLHISLLNDSGEVSSFAFDTIKQAWEYSYLFDTYWSKKTDPNLSPSNFYGGQVWTVRYRRNCLRNGGLKEKKKKMRIRGSNQPFGFYGKGIMWGKDVLLGLHCFSTECQLIAFQLDEMGSVVDSQPFAFSELPILNFRPHIVDLDLDGSGLFGIVTFRASRDDIQLLTCKIERASVGSLSIKVLKAHSVAEFQFDMETNSNVFSVGLVST